MSIHNDGRAIYLYAGKLQLLKGLQLHRLVFWRPILLVNDKGILYDPLSLWFVNLKMSISWEEIAAMYLQELTLRGKKGTKTYQLLCILPKDLEEFGQRQELDGRGRFAVLGAMSMSSAPFMIFGQTIFPQSLEELLVRISDSYQDKIQAYGIEMREKQRVAYG